MAHYFSHLNLFIFFRSNLELEKNNGSLFLLFWVFVVLVCLWFLSVFHSLPLFCSKPMLCSSLSPNPSSDSHMFEVAFCWWNVLAPVTSVLWGNVSRLICQQRGVCVDAQLQLLSQSEKVMTMGPAVPVSVWIAKKCKISKWPSLANSKLATCLNRGDANNFSRKST